MLGNGELKDLHVVLGVVLDLRTIFEELLLGKD